MDCSKCGRHFDNAVFADPDMHECTSSAPVFVSDVLSAPLAQEPEPTAAAQELYAYNAGDMVADAYQPDDRQRESQLLQCVRTRAPE